MGWLCNSRNLWLSAAAVHLRRYKLWSMRRPRESRRPRSRSRGGSVFVSVCKYIYVYVYMCECECVAVKRPSLSLSLSVLLLLLVSLCLWQSKGLEFIIRDFPLEGAERPEHVASSHYSQRCHIIFAHLHLQTQRPGSSGVGLSHVSAPSHPSLSPPSLFSAGN